MESAYKLYNYALTLRPINAFTPPDGLIRVEANPKETEELYGINAQHGIAIYPFLIEQAKRVDYGMPVLLSDSQTDILVDVVLEGMKLDRIEDYLFEIGDTQIRKSFMARIYGLTQNSMLVANEDKFLAALAQRVTIRKKPFAKGVAQ